MIDGRQNPPISLADLIPERILWPGFFEVDGMILLRDGFYQEDYECLRKDISTDEYLHVSRETRLEAVLNTRFLKDIFLGTGFVPDLKTMRELGEMLEANWQTKLNLEFPGRDMKARFVTEFDYTGLAGWWVTACRGPDWRTIAKQIRRTSRGK